MMIHYHSTMFHLYDSLLFYCVLIIFKSYSSSFIFLITTLGINTLEIENVDPDLIKEVIPITLHPLITLPEII